MQINLLQTTDGNGLGVDICKAVDDYTYISHVTSFSSDSRMWTVPFLCVMKTVSVFHPLHGGCLHGRLFFSMFEGLRYHVHGFHHHRHHPRRGDCSLHI